MNVTKSLVIAAFVIGIGAAPVSASDKKDAAKAPITDMTMVKKSDAGICHEKGSPSYERTKNFTPFKKMDECIKSGGTAPKNAGAVAAPAVVIKKSDNGICHDPSSSSYEKTTKFTSFTNIDDCVKSSGKPPKK